MVEEAAVEEEGGERQRAEERSHVHHHLFVYIKTADHLEAKENTFHLCSDGKNLRAVVSS